ncbi:MAG: hypothetical protein IPO69_15915 [Saprospiraceae bacterium]|nr:hypothetical protein [Saprospiraceae bacterium]
MNRHRLLDATIDYISYGLTPQAHLSDESDYYRKSGSSGVLQIENLTLFLQIFQIHISPVSIPIEIIRIRRSIPGNIQLWLQTGHA